MCAGLSQGHVSLSTAQHVTGLITFGKLVHLMLLYIYEARKVKILLQASRGTARESEKNWR